MRIARAFSKRVQIHQPLGCKPSSPHASPCEVLWATEKGKFPVKANGREKNSSMQSKEFIPLWLNKWVLWGRAWIGVWPSQDPQHMWPLLRAGNAVWATWQLSQPDLQVCLLCLHHKSPPRGHFSSGIYWPKTTCIKKCFEILPDNHYEIFKKTCCPQVNEILQVADFATGPNTFPVYHFIAFL